MASRRKAGDAVARLPALSRRAILVGVSATPVLAAAPSGGPVDPIIAISQHWLKVDAERNRLMLAWGQLEGRFMKSDGWGELSTQERTAIREGGRLGEISARLDQLEAESETILDTLPTAAATSVEGVVANLMIVMTLLYPDDHEMTHGMVKRAIADIKALAGLD
ncbi:hypothetical protein [Caulobacter segnis]|uniref:Uncharacterized protein n=1 Tax=Caulobacter segnis TaxID=88688 RepID=A0A2W5V8W0_9CAUL|nr:hypothetical protein [Caulobacter segnis]PZR31725.1 MAG: hypothetical protein DI526_18870 [Caulobacter segnis]